MVTLFLVVLLDLIGFGMIIPVFPFYAAEAGVDPASVIFFLGLYAAGQLVGAPVWGSLSDRIGRRPVLLLTLLGNTVATVMLAFADTGLELAVTRLLSGVAAGNISTAYAYTTDITTDQTRPRALGLLGSAFGVGFILGPALGGVLASMGGGDGAGGLARVAVGAAVLSFAALVLTALRLPESLTPERRAQRHEARAPLGEAFRRPGLRDLLWATVIIVAAVALFQSTLALWAADRLDVGPDTLGWIYGFAGVISVAVQAGIIGALTRRFGAERLARAGTLLIGVGMVAIPPAPSVAWLLVPIAVFGFGSALFNPSMSGLVAASAQPHERGRVLGAYQAAASFGRVLGPVAASGMARVTSLDGPFYAGAAVTFIGLVLVHRLPKTGRLETQE